MYKKTLKRLLVAAVLLALSAVWFVRTPHFERLYYPYHYRAIIESQAADNGLDPLLVAAIIHVESKFDPQAVSRKGALGLMQIMPSTAAWIAYQLHVTGFYTEMLFDPEVNIKFGTWYMANLGQEFGDRLEVVVVAYNAGRGNVKEWLTEGIWSGEFADRGSIPFPESRQFLLRVRTAHAAYIRLYRSK